MLCICFRKNRPINVAVEGVGPTVSASVAFGVNPGGLRCRDPQILEVVS